MKRTYFILLALLFAGLTTVVFAAPPDPDPAPRWASCVNRV